MNLVQTAPVMRPVYKALHRPMTICGVERRLFIGALLIGALAFRLATSLLAGGLVAIGLYCFGLWATQHDPQMLRIILSSSRLRTRYDHVKHDPCAIEVTRC
jgi:type IV secretory pathway VirB3-like protein